MKQTSSLCWTCTRAYALPDPEGCGFHRRERRRVFEDAIIKKRADQDGCTYKTFTVTKCKQYELSMRHLKDTENQKQRRRKSFIQTEPKAISIL